MTDPRRSTSSSMLSIGDLADRLADGQVDLLEVSREPDPETYRQGHIPGARFANWKQLCWHPTDRTFASPEVLRRRLRRLGIEGDRPLVVYGDPVQYGTYAYWTLANAGLDGPSLLLDGTARTWRSLGHELERASDTLPSPIREVDAEARRGVGPPADGTCAVGRDTVLRGLSRADVQILDVRSVEEYRGERVSPTTMEIDHGAERAGRIPGAIHLPYDRLLMDDDRFRDPSELERLVEEVGLRDDVETYVYCRLSHRASLVWFVLTRILGRERVRVYDGSWTEWGSMVGMPIEV